MSQVNTQNTAAAGSASSFQKPDSFQDLDMNEFLDLMIAELQNQDPLNPADNTQLLTQLGQIREITSNDRLTNTLDAMVLGDNMSTASSMIGKTITGMTDIGDEITGIVERATFEDDIIRVHVNGEEIRLTNVREVLPAEAAPDDPLALSRDMTDAAQMIGAFVQGADDEGQMRAGIAEKVTTVGGEVVLNFGDQYLPYRNVELVRVPDQTDYELQYGTDEDADGGENGASETDDSAAA